MKVLYVSTVSSTMNVFMIPHIEMLVENKCQVDVAFKKNKKLKPKLEKMVTNVYELDLNRTLHKNNYFKLTSDLKKVIIENGYDVIHTHTPIASAIVRGACRTLTRVRVIYTAHGFHFYNGSPLKNWLTYYPIEKYLSKYTDTLITINQEDYERAQNFYANNVEFVPGVGIDLEKMTYSIDKVNELKKELEIETDNIILLSVGELNANKNHSLVLDALKALNNNKIKYFICGDGYLKDDLNEYSKKLGLEKQVKFLGLRNDINELLELADAFIFPSYREGLSKSLMEAMAMGKPVVASDIRGNQDLISHNRGGYLFNPNDSRKLSEYIYKLINNVNLRDVFGEYNKDKIKNYSLEKVLHHMARIYKL